MMDSAVLSGILTISNHPVAGSIQVSALKYLVPLGVCTSQGPLDQYRLGFKDLILLLLFANVHIFCALSY
jgi:hypothetical protein